MALYSDPEVLAESESEPLHARRLTVACSSCLAETPVSVVDVIRASFPVSVHLPFGGPYRSFMRCPNCGRRTWCRIAFRP
jgi:hypothetical protein